MKTIEERANHKADISQYRSDYIYDRHSIKVGYIAGATEQKAIDDKTYANIIAEESNTSYESGLEEGKRVTINKACEWINEYTTRVRNTNIGQGVCKFQFMHPLQVDEMLADFREAMEEGK